MPGEDDIVCVFESGMAVPTTVKADDPFAAFSEWSGDADQREYAVL